MRSAADAAPSWLWLPDLARAGETLVLEGDEARYLQKVVRARDGERVTGTDGRGLTATLVVETSRPTVRLRIESRAEVSPPPAAVLLCGAPEGERGDWLVEKLAELGVTRLQPVDTARVQWEAGDRTGRWTRLTVAALRQSRSAWLMEVAEPLPLATALAGLGEGARWWGEPDGAEAAGLPLGRTDAVLGAVGPSSGFSAEEQKMLSEHGFQRVRLAAARLRAETAALAIASLWAARR
jgi:16S rRNA (uracil1498-N3)-methyltransferase